MKTLYLVRHAKSDHPEGVEDFDRPLNEHGHSDARKMAKYLKDNVFEIQHFVTSPAKRALTTCRYFAETYGNPEIKKVEDLYEPLPEDFTKTIFSISDTFQSAALFSHNNGISEFASSLTPETVEMPTCGVAVFELEIDEWSQLEDGKATLLDFFKAKEI